MFGALAVSAVAVASVLSGPPPADHVDTLITTEMANRHIPGVAVAVVKDGRVVKSAGYGVANLELQVPVTPRTVFQIQSITKTFVSTAVLLLADSGTLSLDDPVGKYLTGAPDSWRGITVRHLLTHTSGIKDYVNEPVRDLRLDATEDDVFKATAGRPLNFQPGEKYAYSNVNYLLLAMIVRRQTGEPYGDVLKTRILNPLGMSDTRLMSHSAVVANRASGYLWENAGYRNGDFIAGSVLGQAWGGILSTAEDMAKWAAAVDARRVLPAAVWDQAWTSMTIAGGRESGYGLGWSIEPVNGHRAVGHGGGHVTGFTSYMIVYPDDHLAVVVLTNSSNPRAAPLARRIAGLYIPALAQPLQPAIPDADPKVTALLRDCLTRGAAGQFDEARFGPELWQVISTRRAMVADRLQERGTLRSFELLAHSEASGKRSFRYRVIADKGPYLVAITIEGERFLELRLMDE
jgi:D-alanyl-D-alanine carboxypeptidase